MVKAGESFHPLFLKICFKKHRVMKTRIDEYLEGFPKNKQESLIILVSIVTILRKVYLAANQNPVDSLKYE